MASWLSTHTSRSEAGDTALQSAVIASGKTAMADGAPDPAGAAPDS
jgi:hypothetical protein